MLIQFFSIRKFCLVDSLPYFWWNIVVFWVQIWTVRGMWHWYSPFQQKRVTGQTEQLQATHWNATKSARIVTNPAWLITKQINEQLRQVGATNTHGADTWYLHEALSTRIAHSPHAILTEVTELWQLHKSKHKEYLGNHDEVGLVAVFSTVN